MTTALKGVRGQCHAPAALYPRERPGTHCTEGWVGPRVGLDRCGKSRPPLTRIRFPDRPPRSQSLYRLSYPVHGSSYAVIFFHITILIPTINYTTFTMQAECKQATGNVLLKYLYSNNSPCESTVGLPLFARHYSPLYVP